jgi:hypothetical protein
MLLQYSAPGGTGTPWQHISPAQQVSPAAHDKPSGEHIMPSLLLPPPLLSVPVAAPVLLPASVPEPVTSPLSVAGVPVEPGPCVVSPEADPEAVPGVVVAVVSVAGFVSPELEAELDASVTEDVDVPPSSPQAAAVRANVRAVTKGKGCIVMHGASRVGAWVATGCGPRAASRGRRFVASRHSPFDFAAPRGSANRWNPTPQGAARPLQMGEPVRSSILNFVAVGAVVLATATPPRLARAAVAIAPDDGDLQRAERLYAEGVAAYETHDYEGAADKWTESYAALPEDAAGHRNQMVYNIATAQEQAYEVDKDLQHLRQARLLLASYVDNYKQMYEKTPETKAEVHRANDRIRALDDRIAGVEQGASTDAPDGRNLAFTSGHDPPVDKERLAHNRKLSDDGNKADRFIIAGWAVGGVGLLFLLGGAGTVAGTARSNNRGGQLGGYGALGLGAVGVATGGALLGVGFKKRKLVKQGRVAVAPIVGPGTGGLAVAGRF